MLFKIEYDQFPLMTSYHDKECGFTLEEVEKIALKKMAYAGLKAKIYFANELVKEIEK